MNRSLSLLLAAPLAVLSLVGCSAVDRADEAAHVGDHVLTHEQVAAVVDTQLEYLRDLGAIGPRAEPPAPS